MRLVKVIWDTDGVNPEELGLPEQVAEPEGLDVHEISDWLSDEYGYCVDRFEY